MPHSWIAESYCFLGCQGQMGFCDYVSRISVFGSCWKAVSVWLKTVGGVGGLTLFVLICNLFVEITFTSSKSFIITMESFHLLFTSGQSSGRGRMWGAGGVLLYSALEHKSGHHIHRSQQSSNSCPSVTLAWSMSVIWKIFNILQKHLLPGCGCKWL